MSDTDKWIAVTDDPTTWPTMLPKTEDESPGVEVLTWGAHPHSGTQRRRICRFEGMGRYSGNLMWWETATVTNIKVTHWQPLPLPPVDAEKEKK